jgi:hypothetical protein
MLDELVVVVVVVVVDRCKWTSKHSLPCFG